MKTAAIAELKARLSSYLRQVKAGHEVVVTERGVPVAKIVPLRDIDRRRGRLERLVKAGLVIPGRGRVRPELLVPPEGDPSIGAGVLEALLEERREGR